MNLLVELIYFTLDYWIQTDLAHSKISKLALLTYMLIANPIGLSCC